MLLIPGTTHTITWSKQLLTDEATYYVQAVIRDLRTGETLETLNLDAVSSSYFRKAWTVVQDPSGQGREIEIQKTVYDDAAYTQPSSMYGRWLDQYTILSFPTAPGFGPNGGGGFDYDIVNSALEKNLEKLLKKIITLLDERKTNLSPVLEAIKPLTVQKIPNELVAALEGIRLIARGIDRMHTLLPEFKTYTEKTSEDVKSRETNTASLVAEMKGAIESFIEALPENLSKQMNAELEKVMESISARLEETADAMGNRFATDIEAQLSKPLKISLPGFEVEGKRHEEKQEKKPYQDERVERIMGLSRS